MAPARPALWHRAHRDLLWPCERGLHRWGNEITATLAAPRRNPPKEVRLRFRDREAVPCRLSRSTASLGRSSKASGSNCRATSAPRPWCAYPGSSGRCSHSTSFGCSRKPALNHIQAVGRPVLRHPNPFSPGEGTNRRPFGNTGRAVDISQRCECSPSPLGRGPG